MPNTAKPGDIAQLRLNKDQVYRDSYGNLSVDKDFIIVSEDGYWNRKDINDMSTSDKADFLTNFYELNKDKEVETWIKRVVLVVCILLTGVVYYIIGQDVRLLFNSAILAPVAWSWIFRPIFKKLGIGYKEIDNTINK